VSAPSPPASTTPVTVEAPPADPTTPPASSAASASAANRGVEDVVGPQDVLSITLPGSDYSGLYTVGTDGTFEFPLVGRVPAAGLPLRAVEADLARRLSDGYFRDPQLTVAMAQSRSRRIFIVGEVRSPGSYPLTGGLTLLEALAQAGAPTADASPTAIVLRTGGAPPNVRPGVPGQVDAAEVLQVDLTTLQSGSAAENILLRDGDAVFIGRAEPMRVFVFGEVRAPGVYPVPRGTTVLQAMELAGGALDRRSTGQVTIVRWVSGKKVEVKARLDERVLSGDSIVVP
jgi:polysaccharide export outer membrane protein